MKHLKVAALFVALSVLGCGGPAARRSGRGGEAGGGDNGGGGADSGGMG